MRITLANPSYYEGEAEPEMGQMNNMRIGHRLAVITLAITLGLVLVIGLSLKRLDTVMREGVGDRTKKIVETGYSIVAHYEEEQRSGRMTQEQAQKAALGALKVMRYGSNDYLFVSDHRPFMLMHPMKPEMDGTDIGNQVDIDGVYPFREMSSAVKASGEGVVSYRWPKPGAKEPQPKLSFVKGFAPWGWIIGSGVYVDDLSALIRSEAITMAGIALAILLAVCALTVTLGRTISAPIIRLTQRMRSLADGDTATEIPGGGRGDEIGEMAQALEVFRVTAIKKGEADAAREIAEREQRHVVETVSTHLSDLSHGDLTASIKEEFPPAYVELRANFNDALSKLRTLIGSVADSAAAIRTGSNEIAQASEDLARRTEANAASLEETSAAVTQMGGRIRATAEAANTTVERATGAIGTVSNGRDIADQAVHAMNRVADGAKGIDSVIEGLDKIAFQTRVLAMNAAVEAGRAGEAGRGFAVVADLVSALAMRSEEEAARAREQLTTTRTDIIAAVEMVQKVDGALGHISSDVDEVHKLLDRIASDNQAQSSAISQVTVAIGTMDQSTQQNAAMVEETSAAARNLASEVTSLSDEAARFKVSESARPASARKAVDKAPAIYVSPVKPMAAPKTPAMADAGDDWAAF